MDKLLVIVGPTGTGKSNLAISLAKPYQASIISADSRQVYKEMDIATGKEVKELKAGKAEKHEGYWVVEGVKINLYDYLDPKETFSVAQYQQKALEIIKKLHQESRLPILVGGTGLYISSVTDGLKIPKSPPDFRLRGKLESTPPEELYQKLQEVDPITASRIDKNNPRRLVRALEVYYQTGESISSLQEKYKPEFDILFIGLTAPREKLYEKADLGVEEWLKLGLVEETQELLKKGYSPTLPSMTSIGYRQIAMFLEKKLTLEEAIQRIKFDRHNYIRRQLTWFKRDERIYWFDITDEDSTTRISNLVSQWYNTGSDAT